MPLRIGFDLDGVLADFAAAYRAIDERLHGAAAAPSRAGDPEDEADADEQRIGERGEAAAHGRRGRAATSAGTDHESRMGARRRRDAIWTSIQATGDFWTTLKPTEEGAVARIHAMMLRHRWEVFFITQRPGTAGETVQRQTQRWLLEQGFDLPSVLVVPGSRGAAAAALSLDYHVDDSSKNCIDVKSESRARPLLITQGSDEAMRASARRLGIGVARNISDALDILEKATKARLEPSLLERVAKLVGWV